MNDMNSILESMELRRKMLTESGRLNKETVFAALAAAGIDRVTAAFDGEGDSGQLEEPAAFRGDMQVPLPEATVTVQSAEWNSDRLKPHDLSLLHALETLCYDFLSQEHDGWENNDGAFGEFTLDVAKRTVELEFNGRYSDVHTTHHAF
jgi:hypothetical protein